MKPRARRREGEKEGSEKHYKEVRKRGRGRRDGPQQEKVRSGRQGERRKEKVIVGERERHHRLIRAS